MIELSAVEYCVHPTRRECAPRSITKHGASPLQPGFLKTLLPYGHLVCNGILPWKRCYGKHCSVEEERGAAPAAAAQAAVKFFY